MTGTETERFLQRFEECLAALPSAERSDATREIRSHIEDALAAGEGERELLRRLGSPDRLALSYLASYAVEQKRIAPWTALKHLGFWLSAGLLGLFVVPILATVAVGFGLSAVLAVLAGLLRSMGVGGIQMQLGPGVEVPQYLSLPVSLAVAGLLFLIAWGSWQGLRSYMAYVSSHYRRQRLAQG